MKGTTEVPDVPKPKKNSEDVPRYSTCTIVSKACRETVEVEKEESKLNAKKRKAEESSKEPKKVKTASQSTSDSQSNSSQGETQQGTINHE